MTLLHVVVTSLLWGLVFVGLGGLCLRRGSDPWVSIPLAGFVGMTLCATLAVLLNFAVGLSGGTASLFFWVAAPAALLGLKRWRKERVFWLLPLIIVLLALCAHRPITNYDTGLYHLLAVKWSGAQALPEGLGNLYRRMGYNSSWFALAALTEFDFWRVRSVFTLPVLPVAFFALAWVGAALQWMRRGSSLSSVFMVLCGAVWLKRASHDIVVSLAPDLPVVLLALFIVFLTLRVFEGKGGQDSSWGIWVLSLFTFTLKLSALPVLLGGALASVYTPVFRRKVWVVGMALVMLVPFILRGVVVTGCPAYPSLVGCAWDLPWVIPPPHSLTVDEAAWIKHFARASNLSMQETLSGFGWVPTWFKNVSVHWSLRGALAALTLGLGLILGARLTGRSVPLRSNRVWVCLLWLGLGLVFWFFTAPDPRFGHGYIYGLSLLVLSMGVLPWLTQVPRVSRALPAGALGLALVFLGVTVMKRDLGATLEVPSVRLTEVQTDGGDRAWIPEKGDQCWDSPIMCSPHFNSFIRIESKDGRVKRIWRERETWDRGI